MGDAKIQLSADELSLVQNAGWLLTKNKIIEKVYGLFGETAQEVREWVIKAPVALPAEVAATTPKISKGEKYLGLPYVMLDYPRLFGKEDLFAVRVFFWWGHYFSITLHLKGKYKEQFLPVLTGNLALLQQNDFYACIETDEWRHELAADNYVPIRQQELPAIANMLAVNSFCKVSAKLSFQQWNESKARLTNLYGVLFKSIGIY